MADTFDNKRLDALEELTREQGVQQRKNPVSLLSRTHKKAQVEERRKQWHTAVAQVKKRAKLAGAGLAVTAFVLTANNLYNLPAVKPKIDSAISDISQMLKPSPRNFTQY